jgi:ankyrin repeat protein
MWALEEGHREVVRVLVEHGADVQAKTKGGFTPFLYAARQGDVDSGRLLLEKGAEIDQPGPGGLNPLLLATDSGREAFAIFLLDKGANANAKDSDGLTALHYSMRKGISILRGGTDNENNTDQGYLFRPDMSVLIQALLDHGANPNARVTKSLRRLGVNDRPMMSFGGYSRHAGASGKRRRPEADNLRSHDAPYGGRRRRPVARRSASKGRGKASPGGGEAAGRTGG